MSVPWRDLKYQKIRKGKREEGKKKKGGFWPFGIKKQKGLDPTILEVR